MKTLKSLQIPPYTNMELDISPPLWSTIYVNLKIISKRCIMMTERWLSVDEIAEHLGIKKDTVYKWTRKRNMPFHKVGKLLKFQIKEVDKWVKEGKAAVGGTLSGNNQ